jgi:MFS family permease
MMSIAKTGARGARGLDLLNFFLANAQTGFGPFIAVYLTAHAWTQEGIGFVLTLGTITAMCSQVPAGALVDAVARKRTLAGVGIVGVMLSAVLLAALPFELPVAAAQVLHGFTSVMLTPTIAAISLDLVGHAGLGERLGRNARFAALGNGLAAAAMGLFGTYLSERSVFVVTALLCLPALASLPFIGGHPREKGPSREHADWREVIVLLTDRRLLVFLSCVGLFHLGNAALLPLAAGVATQRFGPDASLIIAACIVVPQAIVALLSPWVGRTAQRHGRRPVLLLGWGAVAVNGGVLALRPAPWLLVGIEAISGVSGAVFGVMLPLIADDLTRGMHRFNLCIGILSLAMYAGAGSSTALAGWVAGAAGDQAAFLTLAAAGLLGTGLLWLAMPETRVEVEGA